MEEKITKIIAIADIHIPSLRGIDNVKEVLSKFITDVRKIVKKEGAEHARVAVLGDVFHNKITITNESIIAVSWFFSELSKTCKTVVIAGNHDMLMNNLDRIDSLSSVFEIGDYPNVTYLDKELDYKSGCYTDNNVVWCLYSSFDSFSTPPIASEKVKNPDAIYVGLIHADINGAVTPTGFESANGLDGGVFKDCDCVMAGHIHKRQELKKEGVKIVYCSSPNQKDFGETVTGHGYVVWDVNDKESIKYKFKDIDNSENGFYKFSINSLEDIENDREEIINL